VYVRHSFVECLTEDKKVICSLTKPVPVRCRQVVFRKINPLGNHVDLGAEVCKRYKEHDIVINAIYAHHGHTEPKTVEATAVCTADALSAARPGARREVLENFLKRVKEIENIATSKMGVTSAYAISAGREVRVIVNAKIISDNEAVLIAKEIAEEIEQQVQYPGEIKVNVIRETRAIELAK